MLRKESTKEEGLSPFKSLPREISIAILRFTDYPTLITFRFASKSHIEFVDSILVDDGEFKLLLLWPSKISKHAAFHGHLEILKWSRTMTSRHFTSFTFKLIKKAAFGNQMHILQWIKEEGDPNFQPDIDLIGPIAGCRHLPIVKWFDDNYGLPFNANHYAYALFSGSLEVLKWFKKEKKHSVDNNGFFSFYIAIKSGFLDIAKWFYYEEGCYIVNDVNQQTSNEEIFSLASKTGNLEMLQWLKDEGFKWDRRAFTYSFKVPNVEKQLDWFKKEGFPWSNGDFVHIALEKQCHRVLRWFEKNECLYYKKMPLMALAAYWGELDHMKWLYDRGIDINEDAFYNALGKNDIPILEWIKEKKKRILPPLDRKTLVHLISKGNHDTLKWLVENRIF